MGLMCPDSLKGRIEMSVYNGIWIAVAVLLVIAIVALAFGDWDDEL